MVKERTTKQVKESLKRNTEELERAKVLEAQIKEQIAKLRDDVKDDMDDLGYSTYPTDVYTYSIVADSVQTKVDRDKLEKEFPNVFTLVTYSEEKSGGLRMRKAKAKKGDN